MMVGVGIDISVTSRIRGVINKESGFMKRVFAEDEISYCMSKSDPWKHFSARFAAKEAFIKAAGKVVDVSEITIVQDESGKPNLVCSGKAGEYLKERNITPFVSLSHDGDNAVAVVVLESTDG